MALPASATIAASNLAVHSPGWPRILQSPSTPIRVHPPLFGKKLQARSLSIRATSVPATSLADGSSPSVVTPPRESTYAPASSPDKSTGETKTKGGLKLVCPICHRQLEGAGSASYSLKAVSRQKFKCGACRREYNSSEGFVDMVIASGAKELVEPELNWGGSNTFRNPLVSFVYERGWRQGFRNAGFPGPEEEWAMARDALRAADGDVVLDVSCGSGLFTRRMAASGLYPLVVALDYSETMMRQTKDFIQSASTLDQGSIALVRADVARLPFETGSVAGVHAGAAMHCWPSPSLAMAEISRVLKPGGVFVATTFLNPSFPIEAIDDIVKPFRKEFMSRSGVYKFWEVEELKELCSLCGLTDFRFESRGGGYASFMFLTATRPESDPASAE